MLKYKIWCYYHLFIFLIFPLNLILSKRFRNIIKNYISNKSFVNDRILSLLKTQFMVHLLPLKSTTKTFHINYIGKSWIYQRIDFIFIFTINSFKISFDSVCQICLEKSFEHHCFKWNVFVNQSQFIMVE